MDSVKISPPQFLLRDHSQIVITVDTYNPQAYSAEAQMYVVGKLRRGVHPDDLEMAILVLQSDYRQSMDTYAVKLLEVAEQVINTLRKNGVMQWVSSRDDHEKEMNGKTRENYLKCFIRNFEDEKWLFDASFSIARQGEITSFPPLTGWCEDELESMRRDVWGLPKDDISTPFNNGPSTASSIYNGQYQLADISEMPETPDRSQTRGAEFLRDMQPTPTPFVFFGCADDPFGTPSLIERPPGYEPPAFVIRKPADW